MSSPVSDVLGPVSDVLRGIDATYDLHVNYQKFWDVRRSFGDAVRRSFGDAGRRKYCLSYVRGLIVYLIDSKPPSTQQWAGTVHKLTMEDYQDSVHDLVKHMVVGRWQPSTGRNRLIGWHEFIAALIALRKLTNEDVQAEISRQVVQDCVTENNNLQARMHARRVSEAESMGQEKPTLESTERRDIASESKWRKTAAYMNSEAISETLASIVALLYEAVDEVDTSKAKEVIAIWQALPVPPGHKTLAMRAEEERLMRARELAEEDGFEIESEPLPVAAAAAAAAAPVESAGSETESDDSRIPSPVLEIADLSDDYVAEPPPAKRPRYEDLEGMRKDIEASVLAYGRKLYEVEHAGSSLAVNIGFACAEVTANVVASVKQV